LAAVANYEGRPGEIFFQIHPEFHFLKTEMLEYSEKNLSVKGENGQNKIAIWINDFDIEFEFIAQARGYRKIAEAKESWSILEIRNPGPGIRAPSGFALQSLADENNLNKLDRLIHRGFNHPGEPPDEGVLGKQRMQSAPAFRKDLNIVTVSEDGTYCSYCGVWLELANQIAYVEPVCTAPDFRRRGLGTAAVLEGIRRCGLEGAGIAMVGSDQPFYLAMGFKKLFGINLWARTLG
jgi:predicted N-acetyltransferase YhbS